MCCLLPKTDGETTFLEGKHVDTVSMIRKHLSHRVRLSKEAFRQSDTERSGRCCNGKTLDVLISNSNRPHLKQSVTQPFGWTASMVQGHTKGKVATEFACFDESCCH